MNLTLDTGHPNMRHSHGGCMKILVIGGTGTVGSAVVRELVARKSEIFVLTRNADKMRSLPTSVTPVQGDLLDPQTVRSAFNDMDAVFLLNAMGPTEAQEGLMAVNGARVGGLKRIVYMSVHKVDKAPYIPHFGAKLAIETAVKGSGIAYTILRPNSFFQTDYMFKDPI